MASKTKAQNAAAAAAANLPPKSMTISQFCPTYHNMSESFYRILKAIGLGPKEIHVGDEPRITFKDAEEWDAWFVTPEAQELVKQRMKEWRECKARERNARKQRTQQPEAR
ncbi:hypothetical protein ACWAT4_27450 [Bradyrhizobium manausense]